MVLQSGLPPYEYAVRTPFRAPDPNSGSAIGPSGILLEQAQFVLTAEIRRFFRVTQSHVLLPFNVYVNTAIAPSGRYEPKVDGSTLGNLLWPGSVIFIDAIDETRLALQTLMSRHSLDTDFTLNEHLADWLQRAYPQSPSGFYFDPDQDVTGFHAHRMPSEVGPIEYISPEVLGSSGVLYDIDFGEVMFQPYPYIASTFHDSTHFRSSVGTTPDTFEIQISPFFPAFQKTDGSLVPLTGREPTSIRLNDVYHTEHIGSGYVRLDGYFLMPTSDYRLGSYLHANAIFSPTNDFNFIIEGIRSLPSAGNFQTSRVFLDPTPQTSGIYRALVRNRKSVFPLIAVESGVVSQWPHPDRSYPGAILNFADTANNIGYHVFDDCIWMTDRNPNSSFGGPVFGYPSGLCALSPWTGHKLWVRYADRTPHTAQPSIGWPAMVGLTRESPADILRLSPNISKPTVTTSGIFRFSRYNDMLDKTADISTTASPVGSLELPLGGNAAGLHDFFFDGSRYWVFAENLVGYDAWTLNTSFDYQDKFVVDANGGTAGVHRIRAALANSKRVIYFAVSGAGSTPLQNVAGGGGSGIFEFSFSSSADPGDGIPGLITLADPKIIKADRYIGHQLTAEIMDIIEVTGATHVRDGTYAFVRWKSNNLPFDGGSVYLVRIEETATHWEVVALSRLETTVGIFMSRRELLYMGY